MGFPSALGGVGLVSTVAGSLVSAYGAEFQGASQAAMYTYQAGVARINAQLASQDATYAREIGETEAQESGMRTAAQVSEAKVAQGAGNIDVNSGSAAAVRQSITGIGQFDEQVIRSSAAKRAFGFDVKSAEETAAAGAYDVAAGTSRTAGTIGAISSIIGGASQVSSKLLQGQSQGLWNLGGSGDSTGIDYAALGNTTIG